MNGTHDEEGNTAYYALLNVSQEASDEEIKRAYRSLAQIYHPDKHTDETRKTAAIAAFTRVQEAYEVLSDPDKRHVYDVYGVMGLKAGMEVSSKLQSREEMLKEWERFKAQQEAKKLEASTSYRGHYITRIDASNLLFPYDKSVSRTADITSAAMTSHVHTQLTDQDVAFIGGTLAVRRNIGGGSFVCGIRRAISPHTAIDIQAVAGIKSLLSVHATRQLSDTTSMGVGVTLSPGQGVGFQVETTRQLTDTVEGEFSWVVGPREIAGMSLSLSKRWERFLARATVEVGASTSLVGRCSYQVSEKSTARVLLRVGLFGYEVGVEASHQISEISSGTLTVSIGVQGVTVRVRYSRAGQVFDFPILLTREQDLRVLAAAYALPPLLTFLLRYYVVRPIARYRRLQKARAMRREGAKGVKEGLVAAAAAAELLRPVARRKMLAEMQSGLVVVEARYGVLDARDAASGQEAAAAGPESDRDAAGAPSDTGSTNGHATDAEDEELGPDADLPPQWLDVTLAVQFQVASGSLTFHAGVPKSGLMGFCDPAPGQPKVLRVLYVYGGQPYRVELIDEESARLPEGGVLVDDEGEAARIMRLYNELCTNLTPSS